MRIVVVVESTEATGGAEQVGLRSARGLRDRGHDVSILAATGDPSATGDVPSIVIYPQGPPRTEGKRAQLDRLWRGDVRQRVAELIGGLPEEAIVHFHNGRVGLSPSALSPLSRRRIFITHHDYGAICPTIGQYDQVSRCVCPERGGSLGCLKRRCIPDSANVKAMLWGGFRLASAAPFLRRAHHVFVGEGSRSVVAPRLGPHARTSVIENPVDAVDPGPRPEVGVDAPYLFVGRLTEEKGPEVVAEAAKRAGRTLRIAGTGPMESAIREANPEAVLLGRLDRDGLARELRGAAAVVMGSRWLEGFPLVLHEAWAAGVATIVPDAIAERAAAERFGESYPVGDAATLAVALRDRTADHWSRVGRAAYEAYWQTPLTMDRHLDRLEKLYAEGGR